MAAQKGRRLDKEVDKLLDYITLMGYHGHKNHPLRTSDGQWLQGEPYDYDLFLPGYHAAFDTKECATRSWHMQPKDIRQADTLLRCQKAGLDAFFLILFEGKVLRKVPAKLASDTLEAGHKTIHMEDCEVWSIERILRQMDGH